MPDGGFDVEGLLAQAAKGSLPSPNASQMPGVRGSIPTMRVSPEAQDSPQSFDVEGLLKQAMKGELKAPSASQAGPQSAGLAANFAAGANKQIFGALGAPVDLATGALNLIPRGINAVAGTQIPTIQNPVGGSEWLGQQFGRISIDPNTVQPTGEAERIAQGIGGGVASVPTLALGGAAAAAGGMSGVPGSVANAIRSSGGATVPSAALTVGAAGVGAGAGQAASDAVPDWAKPYADIAGNLAGAGAVTGAARGLQAGSNLVVRKAGEAGVGFRKDVGGQQATTSQALAAGNKLNASIGPEGKQVVERTLDTEKEAQGLEKQLADPSLTPDERAQAQQQLGEIQGRRVNIVPNANPTTAQIAQTPGATDLENALRVQNGPAFSERAQQQNNARVAAIQGLEPNQGEPASVGHFFTQHLRQLDEAGQQKIAAHTGQVQAQTEAIGGQAPTAQYGGQMREALQAAEAPEHAAASAAFRAVDPDGTWAIPSDPLKATAKQLASEVSPTAQTDGQTNALMARASTLPPVIKFSDLSQMRADANDGLKRLMRTGTAPSEVRRLTLLKQGIDQTIEQSINDRAAVDPAIQDRVNAALVGAPDNSAGEVGFAGTGGARANQASAGGSQGNRLAGNGRIDLAGANPGRVGGAAAPAAGPGALEANVGAEEAGKYYSAVQQWRDLKQKFGQGGVGAVLKENDQGFRIPEGQVPAKIFTAGPTEPAEVERFITAVGGADKAAEIGRNVLANDLRNKGIVRPDGTVDAAKLGVWQRNRAPTLAQFPGLAEQFANIEAAQRTLNEVTAAHKAAIDEFNHSAAAHFLHADPVVAVRRALASPNPTETFTQLAQAVRGNRAAEDGLKRAVVDYIVAQHSSAVPSTGGVDMLKAAGFRSWIAKNKGPMRALFGGQGMQNLEMVAADLRRQAQGPVAAAGSQTAPHHARAARLAVGAVTHGVPLTVLTLLGERLGEHMGEHGMIGAVAVPAIGMAIHAMQQAGVHTINDLVREAMLHPELARVLMEKAQASKTISAMTQRRIATALQGAIMADMAAGEHRQ